MPPVWPSMRYVVKYVVAVASDPETTVTRMFVQTRRDSRSAGREPK